MTSALFIPVILVAIAAGTYLGIRSGRREAERRRTHAHQRNAVSDLIDGDPSNMTLAEVGEALMKQGLGRSEVWAKLQALISVRFLSPEDREWLTAHGWKDPQR